MADNSRMSKMSSKEDECIFSWKLFTGWDYMIGNMTIRFVNRSSTSEEEKKNKDEVYGCVYVVCE